MCLFPERPCVQNQSRLNYKPKATDWEESETEWGWWEGHTETDCVWETHVEIQDTADSLRPDVTLQNPWWFTRIKSHADRRVSSNAALRCLIQTPKISSVRRPRDTRHSRLLVKSDPCLDFQSYCDTEIQAMRYRSDQELNPLAVCPLRCQKGRWDGFQPLCWRFSPKLQDRIIWNCTISTTYREMMQKDTEE